MLVSLPYSINGAVIAFFTRSFPSSQRGGAYGVAQFTLATKRILVFGRRTRRKRVGFQGNIWLWWRLVARLFERWVGRGRGWVDGGNGLHDRRPVYGNVSHHLTRNAYSRDAPRIVLSTAGHIVIK